MKKLLIYERMFSDLILRHKLMELPVGGIFKIDVMKYYKTIDSFPDNWLDYRLKFKSFLNKLFYVTKIPFVVIGLEDNMLSIEKYGEKFDDTKYLKYEPAFKIDRKQTEWARKILNKYRIKKHADEIISKKAI